MILRSRTCSNNKFVIAPIFFRVISTENAISSSDTDPLHKFTMATLAKAAIFCCRTNTCTNIIIIIIAVLSSLSIIILPWCKDVLGLYVCYYTMVNAMHYQPVGQWYWSNSSKLSRLLLLILLLFREEHKRCSPKCPFLKVKDPYNITVGDVLDLEKAAIDFHIVRSTIVEYYILCVVNRRGILSHTCWSVNTVSIGIPFWW